MHPLAEKILQGDTRAVARLLRGIDDRAGSYLAALADLYPHTGRAQVVGITGNPGAGKSTLTDQLIAHYRRAGAKVGVVAVDPSSPFSGGAILGDRIRMQRHALDEKVFIRSLATRGHLGGVSRSTADAVHVLDAWGADVVLIETVGVGQDELEVARIAHTTVVVMAPGLGDEIQAIKAGILEIADIHAVSKCDRDDADRTLTDLKHMLALGALTSQRPLWQIPVVGVSSYTGQGIDELIARIDAHRAVLKSTALGAQRRGRVAAFRLAKTAETVLLEGFRTAAATVSAPLAQRLAQRASDPYSLARELINDTLRKEYPHEVAR